MSLIYKHCNSSSYMNLICEQITKFYLKYVNKKICILNVGNDSQCFDTYFDNFLVDHLDFVNFQKNRLILINHRINVVYFDLPFEGRSYRDIDLITLFISDSNIIEIIENISTNFDLYPNVDLVCLKVPKNYKYRDVLENKVTKKFYTLKLITFDVLFFDVATYRKISFQELEKNQIMSALYNTGDKNIFIDLMKKYIESFETEWIQTQFKEKINDVQIFVNLQQFVNKDTRKLLEKKIVDDISFILKNKFLSITKEFKYIDFGCKDATNTKQIKKILNITKKQSIGIGFDNDIFVVKDNITYLQYNKISTIANESISFITCFQSLNRVENINELLQEFYRISKKNGYLLICEHDCDSLFTRKLIEMEHYLLEITLNNRSYSECCKTFNCRSRMEFTILLYINGFKYIKDIKYPDTSEIHKNPTRYYYALYKKN